jgi:hypothetical protein
MTLASPKPSSVKLPRCRHFTADGSRCRLAVLDTRTNLCFRHSALITSASQPPQNDSVDLTAELLPELSDFDSGVDVNKFLARLLRLVTKGSISPRRAAILAYITNQLLHSHRAIARERGAQEDEPQRIVIDMPRPDRDDPADIPCPDDSPRTAPEPVPMAWTIPGANLDIEKTPS